MCPSSAVEDFSRRKSFSFPPNILTEDGLFSAEKLGTGNFVRIRKFRIPDVHQRRRTPNRNLRGSTVF